MRFVHLAPETLRRSIDRGGIHGAPCIVPIAGGERKLERSVFCMPIVADYWVTYQWLRELRQVHNVRMVAVHFRVADAERLWVGRFGQVHEELEASRAARWVAQHPAGAEVVLPRAVARREVARIAELNQLVGWTGVPESGRAFDCVCPACLGRGEPRFMRRVHRAFMSGVHALRRAASADEILAALGRIEVPLDRARGRIDPARILSLAQHDAPRVRRALASLLGMTRYDQCRGALRALALDADRGVRQQAVGATVRCLGPRRALPELAPAGSTALALLPDTLAWHADTAAAVEVLVALKDHADAEVRTEVVRVAEHLVEDPELPPDQLAALGRLLAAR